MPLVCSILSALSLLPCALHTLGVAGDTQDLTASGLQLVISTI